MASSEKQKQAQMRFEKKRRMEGTSPNKGYYLKCHIKHDADIIDALEAQENKNGYIKELIRRDMEKQG